MVKESTLAVLPEGYLPKKQQSIVSNLGGIVGNILILANGKIQISAEVILENSFDLDNIKFPLV